MHQRAAGMNAGEVMLAKQLMTMAALNVMNGGEEEATLRRSYGMVLSHARETTAR